MSNITIEKYPSGFLLEITGHADSGPLGADIVCAGLSMLCYTLEAELRRLGCLRFAEFTSGGVLIEGQGGGAMWTVLETIEGGLELLCREYPMNVKRASLKGKG